MDFQGPPLSSSYIVVPQRVCFFHFLPPNRCLVLNICSAYVETSSFLLKYTLSHSSLYSSNNQGKGLEKSETVLNIWTSNLGAKPKKKGRFEKLTLFHRWIDLWQWWHAFRYPFGSRGSYWSGRWTKANSLVFLAGAPKYAVSHPCCCSYFQAFYRVSWSHWFQCHSRRLQMRHLMRRQRQFEFFLQPSFLGTLQDLFCAGSRTRSAVRVFGP